MGLKTKVQIGTEWFEGEEVGIKKPEEYWNKYELEDGTILRVKVIVTKIVRTNKRHPLRNDPVYSVMSKTIAEVDVPEELKFKD